MLVSELDILHFVSFWFFFKKIKLGTENRNAKNRHYILPGKVEFCLWALFNEYTMLTQKILEKSKLLSNQTSNQTSNRNFSNMSDSDINLLQSGRFFEKQAQHVWVDKRNRFRTLACFRNKYLSTDFYPQKKQFSIFELFSENVCGKIALLSSTAKLVTFRVDFTPLLRPFPLLPQERKLSFNENLRTQLKNKLWISTSTMNKIWTQSFTQRQVLNKEKNNESLFESIVLKSIHFWIGYLAECQTVIFFQENQNEKRKSHSKKLTVVSMYSLKR